MPAWLPTGAAGRQVTTYLLAGAGSGADAPDNLDDRESADSTAGGVDFMLSPVARLADIVAPRRGADRRLAATIATMAGARRQRGTDRAIVDVNRRSGADTDLPGYLALFYQYRLEATGTHAGLPVD